MKWFRLLSDIHLDIKTISAKPLIFKAWVVLCSMYAKKLEYGMSVVLLDVNEFIRSLNIKQKSLETILKAVHSHFEISLKLVQNNNKIEMDYPKFLEIQKNYFRGVCTTFTSVQRDIRYKNKDIRNKNIDYINIRQADEKSSSHQTSKKDKSPKIIYNRETKQFDNLTEEKIKLWEEVYFTVNVRDQLKRMIVWLEAHPGRRAGNEGFIVRWLNKQVDITDSKPIYNQQQESNSDVFARLKEKYLEEERQAELQETFDA